MFADARTREDMGELETPEAARVVVIDDHQVLAGALKSALNSSPDLEVVAIAGTIAEGIEAVVQGQPEVVVADYRLPDGDISDHLPRLLQGCPTAKVLVLTGWPDESSFMRTMGAGASGFLDKQQGLDDLIDAVRRVLRGELVVAPHFLSLLVRRTGSPDSAGGRGTVLTPRELDVLRLLADGLSTPAIAERLHLSVNTIRNHVSRLLGKLDAHSRLEAVRVGVERGLIRLDPTAR